MRSDPQTVIGLFQFAAASTNRIDCGGRHGTRIDWKRHTEDPTLKRRRICIRMPNPEVRKGMPSVQLTREEFVRRCRARYIDPAYKALDREIEAIIVAAWDAYSHSRKAPNTRKAGPGFSDPEY
jgi:hypothetical protein